MTDKKLHYWPIWSSFANIQLIKELSLPPSYLMQQEYDSRSFSLLKANYNQEENNNYNNENQTKPFHCKKCSKSFKRKHDLDRHTRIHTGERPFLCPCCQKGYTRSDTRRRHFLSEKACSQHPLVIQLQSYQKNLKNKKEL